MTTVTRTILEDPAQHLRLMRNLDERLLAIDSQLQQTQAGVVNLFDSEPARQQQGLKSYLESNGQELLATLNINPALATPGSNISDVAPGVSDDSTKGYSYFSPWINSSTGDLYICTNPSPGAAVWKLL